MGNLHYKLLENAFLLQTGLRLLSSTTTFRDGFAKSSIASRVQMPVPTLSLRSSTRFKKKTSCIKEKKNNQPQTNKQTQQQQNPQPDQNNETGGKSREMGAEEKRGKWIVCVGKAK